ncbi:DNA methyltransferase [Paracoccus yeei]|uniref:DNA methyltransferase n=1 Tax=Paracoccus yeei TaxID=147645 RepID=UPI0020C5756E|nr:DNA methyltransferase [Paracoccus yeei]
MGQHPSYDDFLRAKAAIAPRFGGMQVDEADLNPALKPHTRRMVAWGLHGGRRAWFANFGLHKTATQLETMRVLTETTGRPTLICAPLGVRREFMREAQERFRGSFAVDLKFIRDTDKVDGPGIYLTNYESVREGKVSPDPFVGVSLDEAAILRGFGGTKTFREFMALFAGDDRRDQSNRIKTEGVPYRFVATATPSPNDYIELLSYAGFLDVMDIGQAKTRFFKRNSEKADKLTLHPHKEREFWVWVASWALFLTKPSDICDHPCHRNGQNSKVNGSGSSLSAAASKPMTAKEHGSAPATAAEAALQPQHICNQVGQKAVGAPENGTAETAPPHIGLGAACASDVGGQHTRIGMPMVGEASPSAIDGDAASRHSSLTWASPRLAIPSSGSITTEAMNPETAHGGTGCNRQETDETASCLSAAVGSNASRHGQKNLASAIGASTPDTSSAGQQSASSALDWCNCDEGYELPPLDVRWHELPTDHAAGAAVEKSGQKRMFKDAAADLPTAAREKRESLPARVEKLMQIRAEGPDAHRIIWHDLEAERAALEKAIPTIATVYGSQDLDARETLIGDFADGLVQELGAKPVMLGSGTNLQRHCAWSVFLGIGFKFNDFIQAVHRLRRFGQIADSVRLDMIYTEAEREVRRSLERKWRQHNEMVQKMIDIVKEYGLSEIAMQQALVRALGVERVEASGPDYRCVHNDCVAETRSMADASVQLIVTSIPFSTQYEYSPNYADFGHTDDDGHFWQQMGFLVPELLRVLEPGRIAAIHVKDRIIPGGINGFGFQTLSTLHMDCVREFQRHGFAYLGMKTITTDVVRENNQTYRLGWTEQCKDGSRMGCGVPEYLLIFRRPPTDRSNGYADRPVAKAKMEWDPEAKDWRNEGGYSRARWQVDAHGYMRSNGDRTLLPGDLEGLDADQVYKVWKAHNLSAVYDFEHHVRIAEDLEMKGRLPPTFMLLPPHSLHPDVWTDVARMRTINAEQARKGQEMHLCPLQYDIVDRAIVQYTEPGEWVYDPFGGLMTVPFRAVKLRRKGIGVELNKGYWLDGCKYVKAAQRGVGTPSLFDFLDADQSHPEKLRRTA